MRGQIDTNKTYYKGKLSSALKINKPLELQFITQKLQLAIFDNKGKKMTFLNPELFTESEKENLRVYLRTITREDCGVSRSDIMEIFNRIFPKGEVFQKFQDEITDLDKDIVFTLYMDNNKSLYGKEIHSNIYFPILTPNNVDTNYRIKISNSEDGNETKYEVVANSRIIVTMMDGYETIITSPTLALKEEIENYVNLFNGFRGGKRRSVFISELNSISKGNIARFGTEYIEINNLSELENHESEESIKIG